MDLATDKKLPLDWLQTHCGLSDLDNGAIGIPYFGETGEKLFVRRRNPPGNELRFQQPKGVKLHPYGLNRLETARKAGRIYLCEGESDTWTIWRCGLPALGLPGVNMAKELQHDHIDGLAELLVIPDSDPAGEKFVEAICNRLTELGFAGRVHLVMIPKEHKDVSAWYVAADKDGFRGELQAAVQNAELLTGKAHRSSGKGGSVRDNLSSSIRSTSKAVTLQTTCAATIKPKPLRWLVPDILPLGKLVLLAGDGGMGKSTITIDLTARLSRGECAFGLHYNALAGDTLIATCEDDRRIPQCRA